MANRLNTETTEQDISTNPFSGYDRATLEKLLPILEARQRTQRMNTLRGKVGNVLDTASNVFLQSGGIKPPESQTNDLNNLVTKTILEDYIKSQTPEGKLARQKAQFELGQGIVSPTIQSTMPSIGSISESTPTETLSKSTEEAPPEYIKRPSEDYPGYKWERNPKAEIYHKKQEKRQEMDVKKEQLSDDLQSFFAVDDLIDRAKGGLIDTKSAAFNTWWKSVDQPIDPITGLPDPRGAAAATHAAASKRLRVQLVRAAGDVGNINIVEQEAAEKLIPRWDDSTTTAKLKRAYLRQVAKSVHSGDENEVKKTLREIGIGFVTRKTDEKTPYSITNIPTQTGQDSEYQRYLQLSGGQ